MKYSKIEFWTATTIFAFALFVSSIRGFNEYTQLAANGAKEPLHLLQTLLPVPSCVIATYLAFLALNLYVLPNYWFKQKYFLAISMAAGVLLVTGLVFTVGYSYLRSWEYDQTPNVYAANMMFFSRAFVLASVFLMVYVIYVFVRELLIHQYQQSLAKQTLKAKIAREIYLTLVIWLAILVPFWILRFTWFFQSFVALYTFVLPFCFCIYFLNLYWLIPRYKQSAPADFTKYILGLYSVGMSLGVIELAFLLQVSQRWSLAGYIIMAWLPPLLISTVVAWWVYLVNEDTYKQLTQLKTALGASDANLQSLRSQINPHFLFNVLNTLYGTALYEQAEKTGEGIQKLGDMMRFMLHENALNSIPLTREIAYLHNYIDLQNLRVALSDNIDIKTDITDQYNALHIAPMLLIPFIENAYKHGISFKQRSWINTSLQLNGSVLQMDVYNSLHPEKDNDLEKQRSGIGLENVTQRLQLLYPNKHELVIRQNQSEFFIHLTLQLS